MNCSLYLLRGKSKHVRVFPPQSLNKLKSRCHLNPSEVNATDARFTDHLRNEATARSSGGSELHFLVSASVIYRLARTNGCSEAGRVTRAHPIGACVSRGNVARQRWRLVPIRWTSDVFFSAASGARKVVGGRVGPF